MAASDIGGTADEEEIKLVGNLHDPDYRLYLGETEEPLYMHLGPDGWIYLANKKKSDPDLLSWDQAMRDYPNLKAWMEAIAKEINQLEEKGCWVETTKS